MKTLFLLSLLSVIAACSSTGSGSGSGFGSSNFGTVNQTAIWEKRLPDGTTQPIEFNIDNKKTAEGKSIYKEVNHGDVIRLKPGVYNELPRFSTYWIVYAGAGIGKTLVTSSSGSAQIQSDFSQNMLLMDMSLKNPDIYIQAGTEAITFIRVGVDNIHSVYANGQRENKPTGRAIFVLSDFDKRQVSTSEYVNTLANLYVGPSRVKKNGKFEPYMDERHGGAIFSDAYQTWSNTDVSDLNSYEVRQSFSSVTKKIRSQIASSQLDSITRKSFSILNDNIEKHLTFDSSTASPTMLAEARAQMERGLGFAQNKNFLLAAYAFSRADTLSQGNLDELKQHQATNKKQISRLYGCDVIQSNLDDTKSQSSDMRGAESSVNLTKELAKTQIANSIADISPAMLALGSANSECKVRVNVILDHYIGRDANEAVVSKEPIIHKIDKNALAKIEAAEAAREALWDAAMARTDAAVNRLTSTANQLHQNRNKIETRSGGTYLVLNNKKLTDTSAADRARIESAQKRAQTVLTQTQSEDYEFYQKGYQIESTYYMASKDVYQAELELTYKDFVSTYQVNKIAKTQSIGPCQRSLATDGISADISGPCMGKSGSSWIGYQPDHNMRKEYISNYLEPVLTEFLTQKVIVSFVEEISQKAKQGSAESRLEAALLGHLLGSNSDTQYIAELSEKVLGEALSLKDIEESALY